MSKRKWKQMTKTKEKRETTLFDLPVEDIMMTHVAQYLRMNDLMNLRLCSRKCKYLADVMFAGIRTFVSNNDEKGIPLFLMKTRRLRTFEIRGNYSDGTIHDILSNNYLLNAVGIKYVYNLTSWGLMPLAENCKNISYLYLEGVPISDDFLRALERHKLVNVSFIKAMNKKSPSQKALQVFFEKQFNIEQVNLFHSIDLSPIVSTIATYCPNLKDFEIEDCKLYDDKVLIELADKCPKLELLNVNGVTPKISNKVIKELRSNNKYQRDMLNYESNSDESEDDSEDSWGRWGHRRWNYRCWAYDYDEYEDEEEEEEEDEEDV